MNVSILLAALVAGGPLGAGESPPPKAAKRPPSQPHWMGLEEGLRALRKEYRPIALRYFPAPGPAGAAEVAGAGKDRPEAVLEKLLRDPEVEKDLQNFICVDLPAAGLEKPYPLEAPSPAAPVPAAAAEPAAGKAKAAAPANPASEGGPAVSARLRLAGNLPALLIIDYRD